MSADRRDARTARAYAREIERALERRTGRPGVFTHRDWDLARRWHDEGIPLGLVLEILEERGRRLARGLGSIAAAVEGAWTVVRDGERTPRPGGAPEVGARETGGPYGVAAARCEAGALADALGEAERAFLEGRATAEIDDALDEALERLCPESWRREADSAADDRLRPYRGRLPPAETERVRRRARVDALRAKLALPPTTGRGAGSAIG